MRTDARIAHLLEERFDNMLARLHEAYDGIGHSSGRPYLYFVYPPEKDQYVRRLADDRMHGDDSLHYIHIDLVRLTIDSLAGQEEKRAALLNDPVKGANAGTSIVRLWARRLGQRDRSEPGRSRRRASGRSSSCAAWPRSIRSAIRPA